MNENVEVILLILFISLLFIVPVVSLLILDTKENAQKNNDFCKSQGYELATDSQTIYCGSTFEFWIECDFTYRTPVVERTDCKETNKWGECIDWSKFYEKSNQSCLNN